MRKLLIVLSLVTVISLQNTAYAGKDKAWAAAGGFLGGVVVSNIFNNHHERSHHRSHAHYETITIEKTSHSPHGKQCYHEREGHYEYRKVRVHVPGRWVKSYDDCGRRTKVWRRGYYKWEIEKVWVEDKPSSRKRVYASNRFCR